MDFSESETSLIAKQARSELLDRVATLFSLERSDAEDQNKVLGMQNLVSNAQARAAVNLSLPWHSSAAEIADCNFNIVTLKLLKCMKSLKLAKPWGPKDFFSDVGYHTHNLEGYIPKPESCYTIKASFSRRNSTLEDPRV